MRLKLVTLFAAAAAVAFCTTVGAQAAVVTRTYSFVATDFVGFFFGETPPVAEVSGSFRLTFDPTLIVDEQTTGLEVLSLSWPFAGPVTYSTFPGTLNLAIGIGSSALTRGTDGFALLLDNAGRDFGAASRPLDRFNDFRYTTAGTDDFFRAGDWAFYLGPLPEPPSSVPAPAAFGLLAAGLVSVMGLVRRRRSAARSV